MRLRSLLFALSLILVPALGSAQNPPPSANPGAPAAESVPIPPPTAVPAPAEAPSAAPATPPMTPPAATAPPAASPPVAPTTVGRPTLVPHSGDPVNVDEVTLPGKPAAILSGTSTWDDGFTSLKNAFRRIEEELAKVAIAPAGRPVAVFLETDDLGFRYDAMIPILGIPESRGPLPPEIRFGTTPEGKALRFVHRAPYEEIDQAYEAITAYLDAKNIVAKDAFIEEYVSDLTEPTDDGLVVNIFVQPQ
jgi:effector-binding domain-containing protein